MTGTVAPWVAEGASHLGIIKHAGHAAHIGNELVGTFLEIVGVYVDYLATLIVAARAKSEGGELDGMAWSLTAAEDLDRHGRLAGMAPDGFYQEALKWAPPGGPSAYDRAHGYRLYAGRNKGIRETGDKLFAAMREAEELYTDILNGLQSADPLVRHMNSERRWALELICGPLGDREHALRALRHKMFREIYEKISPALIEARQHPRGE